MKRFYNKLTDTQLLEFALMSNVAQFLLGIMLMLQMFKADPWSAIIVSAILMVPSMSSVYYLRQR